MTLQIRKTAYAVYVMTVILFAAPVTAQGLVPWSTGGWPSGSSWSSMSGYGNWPYNYRLLNRYPGYLQYGSNPVTGYGVTSPGTFLYQRPGFPGGPYGYVQGWVTPHGDFEGTMVIRGNMRKLMGNYYNNLLYNYYFNNY